MIGLKRRECYFLVNVASTLELIQCRPFPLLSLYELMIRAAMRILDRVRREGKKVTSFVSWCGGLPEPSASNVLSPLPSPTSLTDRYHWDTNSPGHQKQSSPPPSTRQATSLMINYIPSLVINFWNLTLRMYHYGRGWRWRDLLIGIHYLMPRNMGWERLGI